MTQALLEALPEEVRKTLRSYVKDTASRFRSGLQAIVLYGSAVRGDYLPGRSNLNVMMVLTTLELEGLKQYAKIHRRWSAERIVVPLFFTESDLDTSRELFPLEYIEMQEHHVVLAGREPFAGRPVDLRRMAMQCEQEVHRNQLRLRQRFVEGGGTIEAIGILLPLSLRRCCRASGGCTVFLARRFPRLLICSWPTCPPPCRLMRRPSRRCGTSSAASSPGPDGDSSALRTLRVCAGTAHPTHENDADGRSS